jgi:flagellar basal body-associated protein FliL
MKKSRIIAITGLLAVVIGVLGYNYVMHGGARDLSQETADYTISSKEIVAEFTTNTASANKKYLEKAVAVEGIVTNKIDNEIILDNGVVCVLKDKNNAIKVNQAITLKGRVVGYDDLMQEIKLDQCSQI